MAKDSRLVDIFRQELKKDKGIMGAFLSAASERGKEKSDIKNILPKSGFSGAIAEKMFGKSYRYGSKKDESRVERVGGDIASSYLGLEATEGQPQAAPKFDCAKLGAIDATAIAADATNFEICLFFFIF